jgi:arabinose-5-phosphate isomerase
MIQPNDVIAAISKSGNTAEMCTLIPLLSQLGNPLIAIVGNLNSKLARAAHFVLNTTIDKEVCPNNLAPTTSTTAQLIMGDALAVVLMEMRNFKPQDFSKYHPGGALGKSLYLTCGDIASQHAAPFVSPETSWKQAIVSITESRLGATAVIKDNVIIGIITDGDIRRMLAKHDDFNALTAQGIMSPHPQQIEANELATLAAQRMQEHKITQLVVTEKGLYKGMVHVHDLYQEGIIS